MYNAINFIARSTCCFDDSHVCSNELFASFLPVGTSPATVFNQRVGIARQGQRGHIGVQDANDGSCLLARVAMRLLETHFFESSNFLGSNLAKNKGLNFGNKILKFKGIKSKNEFLLTIN